MIPGVRNSGGRVKEQVDPEGTDPRHFPGQFSSSSAATVSSSFSGDSWRWLRTDVGAHRREKGGLIIPLVRSDPPDVLLQRRRVFKGARGTHKYGKCGGRPGGNRDQWGNNFGEPRIEFAPRIFLGLHSTSPHSSPLRQASSVPFNGVTAAGESAASPVCMFPPPAAEVAYGARKQPSPRTDRSGGVV